VKQWLSCGAIILSGMATTFASAAAPAPKRDLADLSAGTYHGNVISDARGSSRSDVTITVTKSAANTVTVQSDFSRIPQRTFRLTRAMNTIQNAGRSEVFLLDMSKSPAKLDLTIDDASWSGTRAATPE
jgi:hypothetical protein